MCKKYLEQWKRVNRWYERLEKITYGKEHSLPTDYYQDDVLAFFINCYHLKDWLKNDQLSGVTEQEVERFIKQSTELKICADLCNGSKHLILNRSPKIDKNTKIVSRHYNLQLGGTHPIISIKYEVNADNKTYDAFELSTECLNKWHEFFSSKNLLC